MIIVRIIIGMPYISINILNISIYIINIFYKLSRIANVRPVYSKKFESNEQIFGATEVYIANLHNPDQYFSDG